MSVYEDCFQFISLDGTRSAFDSSGFGQDDDDEWTDYIVPQGKQIRTVETILTKDKGTLMGFKWIGDDGAVLVAVGGIDDRDYRRDPELVVTKLTLNHNQRLLGVKSYSRGWKLALNLSF